MDSMEPLGPYSSGDASAPNSNVLELGERDHAVLACSKVRKPSVRVFNGEFRIHVDA
jgi:hypothetical protein